MTEPVDHEALTQCGATELGVVIPETGPQLAYSEELPTLDYPESASPVRVGLIAAAIIATAGLGVGAVLIGGHLKHADPTPVAAPSTAQVTPPVAPTLAAPTVTTVIVQAPPSTVTQEAKPSQVPVGTPVAADPEFISAMQEQGWIVSNPAVMTLRAHQVCGALQQGATKTAVVQHMLSDAAPPPWTDADIAKANQFVSTAMRIYPVCP